MVLQEISIVLGVVQVLLYVIVVVLEAFKVVFLRSIHSQAWTKFYLILFFLHNIYRMRENKNAN